MKVTAHDPRFQRFAEKFQRCLNLWAPYLDLYFGRAELYVAKREMFGKLLTGGELFMLCQDAVRDAQTDRAQRHGPSLPDVTEA